MSADEFGWQVTKDGRVRITWRGRVVTTLAGAAAERFVRRPKVLPKAQCKPS